MASMRCSSNAMGKRPTTSQRLSRRELAERGAARRARTARRIVWGRRWDLALGVVCLVAGLAYLVFLTYEASTSQRQGHSLVGDFVVGALLVIAAVVAIRVRRRNVDDGVDEVFE